MQSKSPCECVCRPYRPGSGRDVCFSTALRGPFTRRLSAEEYPNQTNKRSIVHCDVPTVLSQPWLKKNTRALRPGHMSISIRDNRSASVGRSLLLVITLIRLGERRNNSEERERERTKRPGSTGDLIGRREGFVC